MEPYHFTVTEEHIKLLRSACVRWDDCEFGAPAIDCKRPYGNSSVYQDIAEILGVDYNERDDDRLLQLHKDTETALQIFLATGEMKTGNYEAERYSNRWCLVGSPRDKGGKEK
jgi:hypothetical protein